MVTRILFIRVFIIFLLKHQREIWLQTFFFVYTTVACNEHSCVGVKKYGHTFFLCGSSHTRLGQ